MNLKALQKFLIQHRQLFFLLLGIFFIFMLYVTPVLAETTTSASGTVALSDASSDDPDYGDSNWLFDLLAKIIFGLAVGIGGLFAGIGGLFLDLSVSETIFKAGTYLNKAGGLGEGVVKTWQMIRDMFNVLFIFSLIYLGIRTVLKSDDSETQRKLGFIIIAALLINFSLYITQALVDFTNTIAVQIYNLIITGNGSIAEYHDKLVKVGADSIAGAFMNIGGFTSLLGSNNIVENVHDPIKVILFAILFMVFLIVAGIVFAMGAFLLIGRFIRLVIYMILSPVMFAGWIFPKFAGYQEKWWSGFFQQAFFAPAFLFMIFLALVVLQKLREAMSATNSLSSDGTIASVMSGSRLGISEFGIVFFVVMMIGFLYAAIKVGEMMSIAGAKGALSITQSVIGGATAGLVARTGRATIGGVSNRLAESESLKNWAGRSVIGQGVLKGTRVVADSNFDVRSTGIAGKYIGEPKKGGYKTRLDEVKKQEEDFAKSLGQVDDADKRVNMFTQEKEAMDHELHELKEQKNNYKDSAREGQLEDLKLERDSIEARYSRDKRANATARESINPTDKAALDANKKQLEEIEDRYEKEKDENIKITGSVQGLKRQKEQEVKAELTERIKELEKATKNQTEIINQEKNRRQTGAYVNAEIFEGTKARFKDAKEELESAKRDFHHIMESATENEKIEAAERIKAAHKVISDLKHEAKKASDQLGYAGMLEGDKGVKGFVTGWAGSAVVGRTRNQNVNAGKAIRKTFGKNSIKEEAGHGKGEHDAAKPAAHAEPAHDAGGHGAEAHH